MNTRQQQILKALISEKKPISGEQIASIIQVSSRTIRNDLREIDNQLMNAGANIVSVRSRGYQLEVYDECKFKQFISQFIEFEKNVPVEPEDRVHYLLKKFLLRQNYFKVEDLADELFVSKSTLKNDLKDVKVILQQFNLKLAQKAKYGLRLAGSERNIRFAISELLFRRPSIIEEKLKRQSWLLPEDSMELIRETALRELKAFDLNLSDIALHNLVVHIAIACQRIKSKQYVDSLNEVEENIQNKKEYIVSKRIIKSMEKMLNLEFPRGEIVYVSMHLLGNRLLLNKNQPELLNSFNYNIIETVKRMISNVEEQMSLNIGNDKELLVAISLHLKPALHRVKYQMNIYNPMLEAIKVNYPIAFEAAIIAGKVIEEDFDIVINENEIGYIALHFGAAIERSKLKIKPKRCLIVCTTGHGSSQLLLYKMRAKFGNKISIIGTTELYNLSMYEEDDIDFIVSTVQLPSTIKIPHVVVSTLLGTSELTEVEQMIGDTQESIINKYLVEELIYAHLSCKTPEEIITYLGEELIKKKMTEEGIVETIMDREQVASTSYGNLVAIPHPLEAKSPHTFWTIATLEKPIDWGKHKVQLVCLLHVADDNKEELKPMYDTLFRFIDDRDIVQKIINALDSCTIMKLIKEM